MAARGDIEGGHGGGANPGGGDDGRTRHTVPTVPAISPAQTVLTDGYMVGSPVFPHCQNCAACPMAQHPATPAQYPMPTPCQCQTDHWVAFAIVRYSNFFLCLLSRNDVHRILACFFSLLTVVFVLASRGLNIPACRYLLSTGIIAHLYSLVQLGDRIWQTAIRGYVPSWPSHNIARYATFSCDLVLAYLLLSSSSVAVLGVNNGSWFYYDSDQDLARCSIAWSFFTFFFAAVSSVFSGYELYEKSILPPASSGNELDDANKPTVEELAAPVVADAGDGSGVANPPGCGVGGADAPAPAAPAPTVMTAGGHVWGLPSSAAALLQYPTTATLTPCQPPPNYSPTALAMFCYSDKALHLLKRDHVRRSIATMFSLYTVAFVLAGRMMPSVAAFRYLFSTGIIALAYSVILLTEGTWGTAMRAWITLPDNVCYYMTFILDLVVSYLLVSSSSVAVLGLEDIRHRSKTPACISIASSFATFLFIAISSIFSGYKLCKIIIGTSASN